MSLYKRSFEVQSALANYCRTGQLVSIPAGKEENLIQYRRLVFNNVNETLQSAFPLTQNLLEEDEWNELVTNFFTNHPCESPQLWSMPKEFYYFLEENPSPILEKYEFLLELIWFEWLEIELYMMEDIDCEYHLQGELRKEKLVLNPEFHLEKFNYPVHLKKAKDISASDKGDYFLSIHRDPESGKVVFTDLSPAFVLMIELLSQSPQTIEKIVTQTCQEFAIEFSTEILDKSLQFFENALKSRLILGFRNT